MSVIDFNHSFSQERKIVRVFTIIQAVGIVLGALLFLFHAPRMLVMLVAFLVVAASAVVLFLLHRKFTALPVVRQKQPLMKENDRLQSQIDTHQETLSGEENARKKIRQDEKHAADKRQADFMAEMAKYRGQRERLGQDERGEIAAYLKNIQQNHFLAGLSAARVTGASILGVGPKMKEKLIAYGINAASDVTLARIQAIQGFGEAKANAVLSWRTDVERKLEREKPLDVPNHVAESIHEQYAHKENQIEGQEKLAGERLRMDLAKIAQQAAVRQSACDKSVAEAKNVLPALRQQAERVRATLEQYQAITFIAFLQCCFGIDHRSGGLRQQAGALAVSVLVVMGTLSQTIFGGVSSAMMVAESIPTRTPTPTATSTPTLTPTLTVTPTATPTHTPTITFTPTITPTFTITPTPTITPSPTITPTPTTTLPAAPGAGNIPANPREIAQVVGVIDGDTIQVQMDGKLYKVNYIGIDAPEVIGSVEYFGYQAASKNSELVAGKSIVMVKDVTDTDSDGNLLRYVIAGGKFVNYELVALGYATVSSNSTDTACDAAFRSAQSTADSRSSGLWQPTPTIVVYVPPVDSGSGGGCDCGRDYDCGDFSSHSQAQSCYESCGGNNWSGLDRDKDGSACEG